MQNLGENRNFFVLSDLEIWQMTWKNNRTLVVCYIELFASFRSYQCIKTWVTVHKYTIWVKIINYLSHVSLKFFGWPWKTIGHHLYATSSFVHHLTDVSELKLELQSGNAQFGSESVIFVPCGLAIWQMTLKNDRAPLLCHFKLCASFCSHCRIRTGVTVWKRQIWIKITETFKFHGWPWKTIRHLS